MDGYFIYVFSAGDRDVLLAANAVPLGKFTSTTGEVYVFENANGLTDLVDTSIITNTLSFGLLPM